ncbi:MAG: hypothetical protein SGJ27_25425 [Candidatus Melainabacteria bacterium]|nr:hypothetical protein [Candidatus Melainabacteria bacterium]
MWKKVSKLMIALALTIPMSVTVVAAQSPQDADIWSYSQDLAMRIQGGRQTGQLQDAEYNNLNGLWTKIEMIRRQYANRRMDDSVRYTMMASLTNLDKQLTDNLHDYDLSHYQNWDAGKRTWRQNWWTGNTSGGGFNDEIDAYERSIRARIDRGRSSGQLTGGELNRLNASYANIDAAQRQYRSAGISNWERNAIMQMFTQLDRDLTTQLRDEDQSRYRYWNAGNKSWNQNWWKPGWNAGSGGGTNVNIGSSFNEEIDAYQNDLRRRIDRGRQSGKLTPNEVNRLLSAYAQIDRSQQQFRIGGFNSTERNSLMTSLTQLDRDITSQLRDDDQSHYRQWDSNKHTWNQNWWKSGRNPNNGGGTNVNIGTNFNEEIDAYQNDLRRRIDRGRQSGKLTPAESTRLLNAYAQIDRSQQQFRTGGFNSTERNSLMTSLTQLDRDITGQLRDDDQSHYRQWDSGKNTWNQSWWKNNVGNNNNVNPRDTSGYGNRSVQAQAFNTEVNEEQRRVKDLLVRGQRNGKLTPQELAELNRQYDEIDRLQQTYRGRGFSRTEKDSIMQKLRALDNNLNSNMRNATLDPNNQRVINREARDDRRDQRWDDRNPNNNRVDPVRNANRNDRNNDNNRTDDRNPNNDRVVTPTPPVTPATTTNPNNNNDDRGNRGNRDRGGRNDRNAAPPTEVKPPVTPTTPPTTDAGNNQQNDGDDKRGGRGRRNRDRDRDRDNNN